ncbi:hypothetical protein LSAT2_023326, partial [Lamellibrachia satsuma]
QLDWLACNAAWTAQAGQIGWRAMQLGRLKQDRLAGVQCSL